MADQQRSTPAVGISNRETPREEAEERREHPPVGANAAQTRRPVAHEGEADIAETDQQQTSKSGLRSTAQKNAEARHPERPMPATSKTDGAFGREGS
jgi:hypothetical protein